MHALKQSGVFLRVGRESYSKRLKDYTCINLSAKEALSYKGKIQIGVRKRKTKKQRGDNSDKKDKS